MSEELTLIIQAAGESLPPGAYHATFQGIEKTENDYGLAWRWKFLTAKGQTILGTSGRDRPPSIKNRTGQWLSALSSKPLAGDVAVTPANYVGKPYLCVMVATANGGSKLETFSAIAV